MVFFNELGPPWPKHDCGAYLTRKLSGKPPKPRWRWQINGYEPCEIYKALPVVDRQSLVVYLRELRSGTSLALCVRDELVRSLIDHILQPFLLKAISPAVWELNTFDQFYDRFEPRAYVCLEAQFAWPSPAEQPRAWF